MSDDETESLIDYQAKVQDALRSVVRAVLEETATDGLPGEHHFFISFRTRAPGVSVPEHLLERFPEEMMIVLQHRFWGLKVERDYFEVGLYFNHQPELLVIPFSSIVGFFDPSVQFALQFTEDGDGSDSGDEGEQMGATTPMAATPVGGLPDALSPAMSEDGDVQLGAQDNSRVTHDGGSPADTAAEDVGKDAAADQDDDAQDGDDSNVVTLDAFRKK